MEILHAFEMTRNRYLRVANILLLFLLLMSGFAGFNKSDSSLGCSALLLLVIIISSKTNLVGLNRVSSCCLIGLSLLIVFPALQLHTNVSAEEGDWSTEWSSWSHKKVWKYLFKHLAIKIGSGSNQEAVGDCKGKTERGISMYDSCMHDC